MPVTEDFTKGIRPLLLEGQRVRVKTGPFEGRMAVVIGHTFASDKDHVQFHTPNHPKRMFAKVESYQLRTRDSRNEVISATPDQLEVRDDINGWGRGDAPEEAPGGEGVADQEAKAEVEKQVDEEPFDEESDD